MNDNLKISILATIDEIVATQNRFHIPIDETEGGEAWAIILRMESKLKEQNDGLETHRQADSGRRREGEGG